MSSSPPPNQAFTADPNNKRLVQIKSSFLTTLQQQSKNDKIGYYDFLLVAKKLAFRFQQSTHLMALKNYFSKNKNAVQCKKLVDALLVAEQSLIDKNTLDRQNKLEQKVIVKFNVPDVQFAPIKEQTLEDEDYESQPRTGRGRTGQLIDQQASFQMEEQAPFQKIGHQTTQENQRQLLEKMTIILSIKVQQMQKKLLLLTHGSSSHSLLNYFDSHIEPEITYEEFKRGVIEVISHCKQKVKLSQDDVKTIFHLLDDQGKGSVGIEDIQKLRSVEQSGIADKMRAFYKQRLNKDMVKNTLFKLGRVKNNSIQIYQLKNASLMEFKQMQDAIINNTNQNYHRSNKGFNIRSQKDVKQRSRIPHFGPLKGAAKWRQNNLSKIQSSSQPHYNVQYQPAFTLPPPNTSNNFSINKQRQKIERILRISKQAHGGKVNRSQKNGETVASKLRSLFIHKVILPREKMLEDQKQKFLRSKITTEQQLAIRPLK